MQIKQPIFMFAYWHDRRWRKFVGATVKIWDLANYLSTKGYNVFLFLPRYDFSEVESKFTTIEVPFIDFPIIRKITFCGSLKNSSSADL